jgi:hypothetical protein
MAALPQHEDAEDARAAVRLRRAGEAVDAGRLDVELVHEARDGILVRLGLGHGGRSLVGGAALGAPATG